MIGLALGQSARARFGTKPFTISTLEVARLVRDDVKKKPGKISDIEQKGGRGVESNSLFLTY